MIHWFFIHTGTYNESGPYYGFFSGFGSDLGELTLIGVILAPVALVYHHHKCTTCRRIGRHRTDDTAQRFCHHHWTRDHIDAARARHRLKFPHHIAHHKPVVTPTITVELDEKKIREVAESKVSQPTKKAPTKRVSAKKTVAKKQAAPRKKAAAVKKSR